MKLNNIELTFDNFSVEMGKLKNEKHFDYLVTIIGEDFGEEGLGCIYILENTDNHERISTRCIARQTGDDYVLPTTIGLWNVPEGAAPGWIFFCRRKSGGNGLQPNKIKRQQLLFI